MNKLSNLNSEVVDVLSRIERLNKLEELHNAQSNPYRLTIEGYVRLREQYIQQLEELLLVLNLRAEIHLNAA